jgi:hypothetical protein
MSGYNQLSRKHKCIVSVMLMRGYTIVSIDDVGIWYNFPVICKGQVRQSTGLYRTIAKNKICCLDKPCIIDYFNHYMNSVICNLFLGGAQG